MRHFFTLALIAVLLVGCGGGATDLRAPDSPPAPANATSDGIELTVLRGASGQPKGVRVSWTRVDVAGVLGYYIYRDTSALPGGNPAGHEGKRINGGNRIDQSGSGTQTLTFDDLFNPDFGQTFFYRLTVVNATSDESDFSNQASITIATHTIGSVNQAGGSIGDLVTITGTWFGDDQESDQVLFTNASGNTIVAADAYDDWTMTQIVVKIPYGAADGRIGVKVDGVTVYSDADNHIDYNEPVVTTLAPTEDWVAHNYVTIDGTDFGPAPDAGGDQTIVYFGGTQAQNSDIDLAAWTSSQIKVKVPAAATGGTVNIKVSVAGNDSNTRPFLIIPHLDSLSPDNGPTGGNVVLSGTNFGGSQETGTVTIDGLTATVTSWGNASVTVQVPANALDGDVVLHRSDGKDTNALGFDVAPSIASFSPGRRLVGEQVTINGLGFGPSRGSSKVTFDGAPLDAVNYLSWVSNKIVVEVPAGCKTGTITVAIVDDSVGSDLDSATTASNLKILLPPPDITGIGQQQ
jgi:IPT/TIG domain